MFNFIRSIWNIKNITRQLSRAPTLNLEVVDDMQQTHIEYPDTQSRLTYSTEKNVTYTVPALYANSSISHPLI